MLCFCITKNENAPFPRPFGATGNDAQKLHAQRHLPVFVVHCTAHEVCFLFVGPGRTIRFPAKTVCVERQGERHVNEIRIRYRRRGLRLGQGDLRGLPGAASEAAGCPGAEPEV